jgi:ligand-binding sensor domain-containing protein
MVNAKGEILQQYNESTNLQSNEILKINSDFNNNIWLSLNNGICKTEPGLDLSFWNKYRGLKDPVLSIKRYKGVLYIGTSTTAYYIDTNNEIQSVKNIAKGQIWCFYETKNSLLAGTANGIFEIKGDSAIQIFNGSYATCIYQSLANPSRLISTDDEFLISFKHINNKWIFEGRWEGITDDIRHVIEDVNGDIWLGTFTNGPIRITPNEQKITAPKKIWHYKASDGVRSYINFIPYPFKNQILWGGKKGLTKYNPISNRFEPFSGLGEEFCNRSNDVAFFKEMPDGKIWISPINNQRYDTGYLQPNSKGGYDWIFAPFSRIPDMSVMAMYIEPDNIARKNGNSGSRSCGSCKKCSSA